MVSGLSPNLQVPQTKYVIARTILLLEHEPGLALLGRLDAMIRCVTGELTLRTKRASGPAAHVISLTLTRV